MNSVQIFLWVGTLHLRQQTGINIGIAGLFVESSICGIAPMIEEKENKRLKRMSSKLGDLTNSERDNSSFLSGKLEKGT
jgi:hypothetical protein